MTNFLRRALIAAVAAAAVTSTAFAGPKAQQKHRVAVGQHGLHLKIPRTQPRKHKAAVGQRGLHFMVPRTQPGLDPDDPALTGGGSLGYNKNIYNW
jgi:hypothetical protein